MPGRVKRGVPSGSVFIVLRDETSPGTPVPGIFIRPLRPKGRLMPARTAYVSRRKPNTENARSGFTSNHVHMSPHDGSENKMTRMFV